MIRDPASEQRSSRIRSHYDRHSEAERFSAARGKLEFERSKAILSRHLSPTALSILDVGGGTGAYSFWLATLGHRVSFIDLSDEQVATVAARDAQVTARLASIAQGTALDLRFPEKSFDVVLAMGPLYHLPPSERLVALGEMRRVLRDEGFIACAYISRFAALMDGYKKGLIYDPAYVPLALGDIERGVHDSPDDDRYFTLAYMHRPEEIVPELERAGFCTRELCAVEGFFQTYPHLERFVEDPESFSQLLKHAELVEKEPSLMGASAHLLAIATKGGSATLWAEDATLLPRIG